MAASATAVLRRGGVRLGILAVVTVLFVAHFFSGKSAPSLLSYLPLLPTPCSTCPPDPYASPGFLLPINNLTESRWVPFPSALGLGQMRMRDLDPLGKAWWEDQSEAEGMMAEGFTRMVQDRRVEGLEWARGKTVLVVGSSHDRGNVHQWCDVVGGSMYLWHGHIGGVCTVPWLDDFKIVTWFLTSMCDDSSDYQPWVGGDQRPLFFEGRIRDVIWPFMVKSGLEDMKVDLMTVTSTMWDDSFLWHHGDMMHLATHSEELMIYGLYWHELLWHRSRIVELVTWLKDRYGHETPMMWRVRHLREKNNHGGKIRVAQLDQSNRAVAKEMGIPLFTWGDKIEGYINYHDQDQHYQIGPQTYVFGDMLFSYLRQALSPGCWKCLKV